MLFNYINTNICFTAEYNTFGTVFAGLVPLMVFASTAGKHVRPKDKEKERESDRRKRQWEEDKARRDWERQKRREQARAHSRRER